LKIPRPTKDDKALFTRLTPKSPRITTRLMFGNDAAFVNGNLFFGIYGPDVFVRLPADEAKELLEEKGAKAFEPIRGHAMSGYLVLPRDWGKDSTKMEKWVSKALEWTSNLPAKKLKN
jgi:TfoX/Sxy family transcriptional regulator of competence genes